MSIEDEENFTYCNEFYSNFGKVLGDLKIDIDDA
jgi:hypothetical protein